EVTTRSKGTPLRMCVLLHQGFSAYAATAPDTVRREWQKIEGRFERVEYIDDSKELLRLLVELTEAQHRTQTNVPSARAFSAQAKSLLAAGMFKEFKHAELASMLARVFPLDGSALFLLPRISARVAQNERTLFNFLQSADWSARVGADSLYRYFEPAMRQDVGPGGTYRAPVSVAGIQDETVRTAMAPDVHAKVCDELDLLDGAGTDFDFAAVSAGKATPVFFGSAMNNFGVQLLLDNFLKLAPPPAARKSGSQTVEPVYEPFSGFVFKIQANMNPKHRDRVSFIRVVSGCFRRDMLATHVRTGKPVRLGNSQRLFAQDRETVDEAWAGDVVGIVGNYDFLIGDTVSEDASLNYSEIPRFPPECFAYIRNSSTAKFKRFREGLDQLLKEGVAQQFELPD
ncbi:MAG: hypothetical protein EBR07_12010, partial [Planctomycetes bacterium]|nr:hypothetical protein [Planctomycetota bacterium]